MNGHRSARDIESRLVTAGGPLAVPATCGRLIAIIVGIDHYEDPAVPDLACAVNDAESVAGAICQTHSAAALELVLLTDPPRDAGSGRPSRDGILAAAWQAAASAGEQDTVLFYFAGHGGMLHQRPCLFPVDLQVTNDRDEVTVSRVLPANELQEVFRACPCRRRVMFLDCCQSAFSHGDVGQTWPVAQSGAFGRALPWRTGMPVATELVAALQRSSPDWSLVLACGPNEVSLEDPEWGAHGVFSHFLATGLRGEADLDRDGVVSLPELVQYLADHIPRQAEAIVTELRDRGGPAPRQAGQNPVMIWSGPIAFPLTRCVDERRAGWRVGVLPLWLRLFTRRLPYAMAVEGMARYGTALLYGMAMALTVLLFVLDVERELGAVLAAVVGVASGLLWLANFALAGAANELRWHSGGYVAATLTTIWHAVVFLLVAGLPVGDEALRAVQLAAGLLVVLTLMIVFGHNALHCIISLADLVKRDLRVAGRRAFVQLDRQWIHADIDNMLAMVSASPKLYFTLGLIVAVLAVSHAGYVLVTLPRAEGAEGAALHLTRDFVLLVLVQWQVHWFAASYRKLRGILLPER